MPTDSHSTVDDLKRLVASFVAERGWEQFHTPKNLATSILIEAAELAEHFQWATPAEAETLAEGVTSEHPIAQEVADVLAYVLAIANRMDIDLSEALHAKMARNAAKYPAAAGGAHGSSDPGSAADAAPAGSAADVSRYPTMDGG